MSTKNTRAAHVLKSWLKSMGASYNSDEDAIFVNGVSFTPGKDFSVESILSSDINVVRKEVAQIFAKAGIGEPEFPERGEVLPPRSNYKNFYESVYMRHRTIQRSPNPSNEDFAKYEPIVQHTARLAFHKFKPLADSMGFEVADFENIARIHLITFLHLYAYASSEKVIKNDMYAYLFQRFNEWGLITSKKAKYATSHPSQVAGIEPESLTFLESGEPSPDAEYETGEYILEDFETQKTRTLRIEPKKLLGLRFVMNRKELTDSEVETLWESLRSGKLRMSGPVRREQPKTSPRRVLQQKLAALPQAERRSALQKAASLSDLSSDAKNLAARMIKEI